MHDALLSGLPKLRVRERKSEGKERSNEGRSREEGGGRGERERRGGEREGGGWRERGGARGAPQQQHLGVKAFTVAERVVGTQGLRNFAHTVQHLFEVKPHNVMMPFNTMACTSCGRSPQRPTRPLPS